MIKVKICGVTNSQDALWAANLGADYVGLNFYPQSPRKISAQQAKKIVAQLPPFVTPVGIFVDGSLLTITQLLKKTPLKGIQLHGNETADFCREVKALGVPVIKAIRLENPLDLTLLDPYLDHVDFFLFDTYSTTEAGGTGLAFDWSWVSKASDLTKPWFLSGGLTPENVRDAIHQMHPPALDVCSGVERLPTRKDYDAMKRFIQTVRTTK